MGFGKTNFIPDFQIENGAIIVANVRVHCESLSVNVTFDGPTPAKWAELAETARNGTVQEFEADAGELLGSDWSNLPLVCRQVSRQVMAAKM